jgi:glycyl-tRNA synthetase beta chain
MPATADFLVEIGTEELPPKALRDLEMAFAESLGRRIAAAALGTAPTRSFATPRRLAVLVPEVRLEQPAQQIEKRGPPVKVAFGADGKPTRAAQAFASGCGVAVSALERLETAAGAWLVFRGTSPGKPAADILPDIVAAALAELPAPRRMRWGNHDIEFVRPVHWLVMMLGNTVLPAEILGLKAGRRTRGHRYLAAGPIDLKTPADYLPALAGEGFVLADFEDRQHRIREIASAAGQALGGEAILDPAVLDEVTALVEWPVAVIGRFDPAYLLLPDEVLAATLQGHQRYFPARGADGKLLPNFIAISNLQSRDPEQVRRGNERVVEPRLADAAFFLEQDLRQPLAARIGALAEVVFQRGLGSLKDKSARIAELGKRLATTLPAPATVVERAALLAKTDLLTNLVKEFPELQGCMGRHYARHDGEPEEVATAIEEQYLPRHAGDRLAATAAGRCLALADRLDSLAGIFALGKRPSGNKDPFGLRRSALGVLRTLIEARIELSLPDILRAAIAAQPVRIADPEALATELYEFMIDRLRAWYMDGQAPGLAPGDISPEIFEAVRLRSPASPLDFDERLRAVTAFMSMSEAQSLAVANKRIANILKGVTDPLPPDIDPALFDQREERRLHEALEDLLPLHRSGLASRQYAEVLRRLAALRDPLDAFFTAVMVMTEDERRRRNRLALLQRLRRVFLDVADLSCLNPS